MTVVLAYDDQRENTSKRVLYRTRGENKGVSVKNVGNGSEKYHFVKGREYTPLALYILYPRKKGDNFGILSSNLGGGAIGSVRQVFCR